MSYQNVSLAKRLICLHAALLSISGCEAESEHAGRVQSTVDILIEDALIADGTGAPAYRADLVVDDGVILTIGDIEEGVVKADRRIDAAGRVLSPGFIDAHTHGDPIEEDWSGFLAMGVTTISLGHDGRTAGYLWNSDHSEVSSSLRDWMQTVEEKGSQLNVIPLSGHGTLRYQTGVNTFQGSLSSEQLSSMQEQLREDLEAGAFGLTSGLEYVPGIYSSEREMVALAKIVGEYDGVIMSHMRTEDDEDIEDVGIAELVAQGQHARIHIAHLKIVYGRGKERAIQLIEFIESIAESGVQISADIYPYTAGYTGVGILFPDWALPPSEYSAVVAERRAELAAYLEARVLKRNGPGALLFGTEPYAGKTLEQAADEANSTFVDFLIDIGPDGGAGAHFTQDQDTHDALVVSELTAISTDGAPNAPHPRSTGTYATLIERYVKNTGDLTIEQAVHKATGLPASIFHIDDRGVIKEGARADLVLFDPERVRATSDYTNYASLAVGFDMVFVNGEIAWEAGKSTSGRFGQVLRHKPR